jgi:hypothetical protein
MFTGPDGLGNLMGRKNLHTQGGDMERLVWRLLIGFVVVGCLTKGSFAQQALTWREVRETFEKKNPTLLAARIGINESQAQQI